MIDTPCYALIRGGVVRQTSPDELCIRNVIATTGALMRYGAPTEPMTCEPVVVVSRERYRELTERERTER